MSLPRLAIRLDKVVADLLDLTSHDGGPKAKFFLGRGFSLDDCMPLIQALGRHGTDHWPGRTIATRFGEKHVLVGPMPCPDGSAPQVLSVWMLSSDGAEAALVTAYPER